MPEPKRSILNRPRQWQRTVTCLVLLTLALLHPANARGLQQQAPNPDRAPPQLDHGLPVASPSAVGFDAVVLDSLARSIERGDHGQIDAMVLLRDGKLVFERYFGGYGPYTLHTLQSVTKSVASTLIGLALQIGAIQSLDQPVSDFFPEYSHHFAADERKARMTLRHLLSMTSGIDWPEQGVSYSGQNIVWTLSSAYDWPGYVLSRPMVAEPGEVFNYSTGVSALLGVIIQKATGMRADAFAERYLFGPLRIPNYGWWRNVRHPDAWVHTGGGLHVSPRDLAKIGYLFANEGRWLDRQILSPDWIEAASTPWQPTGRSPTESYGFQWWLRPLKKDGGDGTRPNDIIHGWGWGGQHLFIIPSLDMIVVFTGSNFTNRQLERRPIDLLYDHILPALTRSAAVKGSGAPAAGSTDQRSAATGEANGTAQ